MKSFQDFRADISIIEMASSIGYVPDRRKGKKWPVLENGNDERIIIVNPKSSSNQGYFNPDDDNDKGTLIDFIKNRLGKEFPNDSSLSEAMNINKTLYAFNKEDLPELTASYPKNKPDKPFTVEGLTAELIKPDYLFFRHINVDTLLSKEFTGRVLNIRNGNFINIAFPFYGIDEKIIGLEKRNHSYDMFVDGSDRTKSIWHSNIPEKLEEIFIAESAIDAISYHQMKQPQNAVYISVGGSLSSGQIALIRALKDKSTRAKNVQFVSITDNDKAGRLYDQKLTDWLLPDKLIIEKPTAKDYNKDLENMSRCATENLTSFKRKK